MSRKESGCGSLIAAAMAVIGLVLFVNYLADGIGPKGQTMRPWSVSGSQGGARFVVVERSDASNQAVYQRAAREICGRAWCQVNFWVGGDPVGTALPFSPAQSKAQAAAYLQNPDTGVNRWAWNCGTYFPGASPCLATDN